MVSSSTPLLSVFISRARRSFWIINMFKELATWNLELEFFALISVGISILFHFASTKPHKIGDCWTMWERYSVDVPLLLSGNSSFTRWLLKRETKKFNDPAWFTHFTRGNRSNSIDYFLRDWKLIHERIESNYTLGCSKCRVYETTQINIFGESNLSATKFVEAPWFQII